MKIAVSANLYSLILLICFLPISYSKYSLNFSYLILFVVLMALTNSKIKLRAPIVFWIAAFYFIYILLVALFFRLLEHDTYLISRTFISFVVLCSPFLFFFFYPSKVFQNALCNSLMIAGTLYSLHSNFLFFVSGADKLVVGSSHDIVVLIPALSIALYRILDVNYKTTWTTYLFAFLIFSGCLLTFSRGAFVALFIFILFVLFTSVKWVLIQKLKTFLIFAFLTIFLLAFYPTILMFFYESTYHRWFVDNTLASILDGSAAIGGATSESERLSYWKMAYRYTAENYFFGSGYLGMWIIGDPNFTGKGIVDTTKITGSAHSLYVDVFFRSGIFGLCFYVYGLALILKRLSTINMVYCGAFLAILVGCIFNESLKMGHGAAVLAFFILVSKPEIGAIRKS